MSLSQFVPSEPVVEVVTLPLSEDGRLVVDDPRQLFDAEFSRSGPDLLMAGDGAATIRVPGYFADPVPDDIHTADGAVLRGELVARLAGPVAPGQYAQAGTAIGASPIGQVETASGTATVKRADGTVETLQVGVKIFENDVVQTDDGSAVSITFADGTIFSLAAASRMVIDELIYDPAGSSNSGAFSLIQGSFVFIAGQVARTGGMEVSTPSATMGIRGTMVIVQIETVNGIVSSEVTLTRDPDGHVGRVELRGLNGDLIADITDINSKWVVSALDGAVREIERTQDDDAADNVLIADAVAAYQSAFARVDQGDTFVTLGDPGKTQGNDPAEAPQDEDLKLDEFDEPLGIQPQQEEPPAEDDGTDGSFDEGRYVPPTLSDGVEILVTGFEDPGDDITGKIDLEARNGEPATFRLENGPGNGTATVNPDGTFEYRPRENFNGEDAFSYVAVDGSGREETGTVIVVVLPVNDAPVLDDAEAAGSEDGTVIGKVAGTDVDGDALTYTLKSGAAHGLVNLQPDGTYAYVPDADFNGQDSFAVEVSDGQGGFGLATVIVRIAPVNDAPVVTTAPGDDAGTVTEDAAPSTSGVLAATDADIGAFLSWSGSAEGEFGRFDMDGDGHWTFTLGAAADALSAGETVTERFVATVTDDKGATATDTVTVTIKGTGDAARITGATTGSVTEDGAPGTVSGNLDHTDVDRLDADDTFQAVAEGAASRFGHGTYGVSADGTWVYTLDNADPAVDALGQGQELTDSFTVRAGDGTAQAVTVTIRGANDAAVIVGAKTGSVTENAEVATVSGNLDHTDVDANNADDLFQAVAAPAASRFGYGSYTVTAAGVWTYVLDNGDTVVNALDKGDTLTDRFDVLAEDGTVQQVTIFIRGGNDAAKIVGDTAGTVTEDSEVARAIGDLDHTDVDGDDADGFFQQVAAPALTDKGYGTYTVDAAGRWVFRLDNGNDAVDALGQGQELTDRFTVRSGDGTPQVVTITIRGANDAAVFTGDIAGTTSEDGETAAVTGDIDHTDVDADNDDDVFQQVPEATLSTGGFGHFTVSESGVWVYTLDDANPLVDALDEGDTLIDTFVVRAQDGTGQVVTITIRGANDAAVFTGDVEGTVTEDDEVILVSGNIDHTDVDGDDADDLFQAVAAPAASAFGYGTYVVDAAGNWTYTLDNANPAVDALGPDDTLTDTFTVYSGDGTPQVVTITINGANDAPVVAEETVIELIGAGSFEGQLEAQDVDGDGLFFALGDAGPQHGTVTIDPDGHFIYVPDDGYLGIDRFDYTVTDADGTTVTARVTAEVQSDAIVQINDSFIATLEINAAPAEDLGAGVAELKIIPNAPAINLVVAIDASDAVSAEDWARQTQLVSDGLARLATQFAGSGVAVTVQIIAYGAAAEVLQPFDLQDPALSGALAGLSQIGGAPDWAAALDAAKAYFDGQPGTESNQVIFTSAAASADEGWTQALADLKDAEANGYAVDVEAFILANSELAPASLSALDGDAGYLVDAGDFADAVPVPAGVAPRPVLFEVSLEADGRDYGVIASGIPILSGSAEPVDGLISFAEIDGIADLLGAHNRFGVKAAFADEGTAPEGMPTLFVSDVLGIADTAQVLAGRSESDLLFGSDMADRISGRGGNDLIMGYGGNDTLSGGAGADIVLAGGGDDRIVVNFDTGGGIERVDGGAGRDVLAVNQAGDIGTDLLPALDITDIEAIDMANGLANRLTLTLDDIVDLSSTADSELEALLDAALPESAMIYGDALDTLNLQDGADGGFRLAQAGTVRDGNGNDFAIYDYVENGNVLATLGIDDDIAVTVLPVA